MQSGVQFSCPQAQVDEAVMFVDFVEQFSVLFAGPIIEECVMLQEGIHQSDDHLALAITQKSWC